MVGDRPTNHTINVYAALARSYARNIDFCPTCTNYMSLHIRAEMDAIDEIDAY